jgi:hypothetical protein
VILTAKKTINVKIAAEGKTEGYQNVTFEGKPVSVRTKDLGKITALMNAGYSMEGLYEDSTQHTTLKTARVATNVANERAAGAALDQNAKAVYRLLDGTSKTEGRALDFKKRATSEKTKAKALNDLLNSVLPRFIKYSDSTP